VHKTRQGTEHIEPCLDVGTSCPTSKVNICSRQKRSQHTNIQHEGFGVGRRVVGNFLLCNWTCRGRMEGMFLV